ncbi:MAG: tyrosine-type recombinase/integrase [Thermoleophilaceae bacterium]|nr:tyrosine-type recombinase/integrase [Thermoleophilaceae bacterium]
MSVHRAEGGWEVRWREGGRGSRQHAQTFKRKGDADLFDAAIKRRKALGELALMEAGNRTVEELAVEWWEKYAKPNLARNTLGNYARGLDRYVIPRLGRLRLRELTPEAVAGFRADLERAGVGRDSTRVSMVVLQAMFRQAVLWRWVPDNPVKHVKKPSAKRETAVVCLAPAQVEAVRSVLLAEGRLYAATMISLVAYQGLRVPEELLALEVRHVRCNTLLIEQRNIDGEIVAGQKVRGFHPRAIDLLEPVRRDVAECLLAVGRPSGRALLFPRRDGRPWLRHDYQNWRRRVWHAAREHAGIEPLPPYDLRHAFASLQIRAGLSIPELAEQMGHSPQMTVNTYTHVIRELRGLPALSAEEQILQAREQPRRWRAELAS